MVLLGFLMIILALTPAWLIWTPWMKHLWVKISLCVLSSIVGIFFLTMCVSYSDLSDQYDSTIKAGGDMLLIIGEEYKCLPTEYNSKQIGDCALKFIADVKTLVHDYPIFVGAMQ